MAAKLTRRTFVGLVAAAGGAALSGCGASPGNETGGTVESNAATPQRIKMAVYRDPNCGCCEEWAAIARKAGYDVTLVDHPNMSAIKRRYGLPEELSSCHTAPNSPATSSRDMYRSATSTVCWKDVRPVSRGLPSPVCRGARRGWKCPAARRIRSRSLRSMPPARAAFLPIQRWGPPDERAKHETVHHR